MNKKLRQFFIIPLICLFGVVGCQETESADTMEPTATPQAVVITQQEENIPATATEPPVSTETTQQIKNTPTTMPESTEPDPVASFQKESSLYPAIAPSLVGLDFPVTEPWTLSSLYGTNQLIMEINDAPLITIHTGETDTYANSDDLLEIVSTIVLLWDEFVPWDEPPTILQEASDPQAIDQFIVQKVIYQRDANFTEIVYLGEQEPRFILLRMVVPAQNSSGWWPISETLGLTYDEFLVFSQTILDDFLKTIQFQAIAPIPDLQPGIEYTDQSWSGGPQRNYYHYTSPTQQQVHISVTPIDGFREIPLIQVWETAGILNWPVEEAIDLANPDMVSTEPASGSATTLSFTAEANQVYLIGIIDSDNIPIFDITYTVALTTEE